MDKAYDEKYCSTRYRGWGIDGIGRPRVSTVVIVVEALQASFD
ncbi:hypothetical protein ADICYQ_0834 [Cyclobacterium qasimii M12-11B]|uniref:Uncharacterized protein n=1 Tax=Cyclobacterium qasimii M12-11B TaxID=641524 RepID=S7X407_9BACT|nr:hypothetical protein ADICYQ_0834 [Cyclobacterium qasimii M12-11B]